MTTLDELLKVVDTLSPEELSELQNYVQQRQQSTTTDKATALKAAIAALRNGLSEQDLDEIEWAMNAEFVKPLDKSEWQE